MDKATLAARLKVTRVAVDKALDGRSKSMTAENCALTARILKVNHFWLATGDGRMESATEYPAPEPRDPLVACENCGTYGWPMQTIKLHEYKRLSERQQGHIEGQIRTMLDSLDDKSAGSQEAA